METKTNTHTLKITKDKIQKQSFEFLGYNFKAIKTILTGDFFENSNYLLDTHKPLLSIKKNNYTWEKFYKKVKATYKTKEFDLFLCEENNLIYIPGNNLFKFNAYILGITEKPNKAKQREIKKQTYQQFMIEKSKLEDWFHYSVEIKITNKQPCDNIALKEFEIKIQRQEKNGYSMTTFKPLRTITNYIGLLRNLIEEFKMSSCYFRLNNSSLHNLLVFDYYDNPLIWQEKMGNIYKKFENGR